MDIEQVFIDKYVYIDSNIFIYVFEDIEPYSVPASKVLEMSEQGRCRIATCYLTLMEILVRPIAENDKEIVAKYLDLLAPSKYLNMIELEKDVLVKAAEIRAKSRIKTPDAIHLAATQVAQCDLFFTNDQRVSQFCSLGRSDLPAFVGLIGGEN